MLLVLSAAAEADASKGKWEQVIRMPGEEEPVATHGGEGLEVEEADGVGTRWAVLVAGSSGYGNYRHQVSAVRDRMHGCLCAFTRVVGAYGVRFRAWHGRSIAAAVLKVWGSPKFSCENQDAVLKIIKIILTEVLEFVNL